MFCWGSSLHGELGLGGIEEEQVSVHHHDNPSVSIVLLFQLQPTSHIQTTTTTTTTHTRRSLLISISTFLFPIVQFIELFASLISDIHSRRIYMGTSEQSKQRCLWWKPHSFFDVWWEDFLMREQWLQSVGSQSSQEEATCVFYCAIAPSFNLHST